jgi:hypothetical protein
MSTRRGSWHVDIMMFQLQHQDVRTTLSLDDDVSAKLKAEVRRSGKPFKEVVNECLRLALSNRRRDRSPEPPFEIRPRDLGALKPGLSLDNIGDLLEAAEGPLHR